MAAPAGAYVLRNVTLTIGATAYANQVTRVRLVPDTPIQTIRTLVPDGVVQDVDSATYVLQLAGIQDWTDSQGLCRAIDDAAGTQLTFTFVPKTGGVSVEVDVIAMNMPFGGDQGEFATFEVELPVVGSPVYTDPA